MPLEIGTWIEDLVPTNPVGSDPVAAGDDHIRLVKSVLQNQFPSLGAEAVDATAAAINQVCENPPAFQGPIALTANDQLITLPTWANRHILTFEGIVTAANSGVAQVRIGTGNVLDTSATYDGSVSDIRSTAVTSEETPEFFGLARELLTTGLGLNGKIELEKQPTTNTWHYTLQANYQARNQHVLASGWKSLSGPLDVVALSSFSSTISGGNVYVRSEA